MWRKLTFLISIGLLLGLVGSAAAKSYTWDNGASSDDSWCTGENWNPDADVGDPNNKDTVDFDPLNDGPTIDCNVHILNVAPGGPGAGKHVVVDVAADGNIVVEHQWNWEGGAGDATINVYGRIAVLGKLADRDENDDFRWPNDGKGYLNIYPGAEIYVLDWMRGADDDGIYEVNMTGGDVNVGRFKIGDNGSGNFRMTGGTFITRDDFIIRGRGGAWFEVLIDGGAELIIEDTYMAPEEEEAGARINVDNGYIECRDWAAAGENWILDINEGELRIKDPTTAGGTGAMLNKIKAWIANGQITGNNGTVTPIVTTDGADVVVTVSFTHYKAWNPKPAHRTTNLCPIDVNLAWTPGIYADDVNVYFGPNEADVNGSKDPCLVRTDANTWEIPYTLKADTTYYWRVDSVNDVCDGSPWKGGVWDFTTTDGSGYDPDPCDGANGIKASTISGLTWTKSCVADTHKVYYAPNMPDDITLFEDDFDYANIADDPNWTVYAGWKIENKSRDPNFDDHDHNIAMVDTTSEVFLESNDVNVNPVEANAIDIRVFVWLEEMGGIFELQAWNGTTWDVIEDWNSNDPCEQWIEYEKDLTAKKYIRTDFKIRFRADLSGSKAAVYIDDPRIRNTWPIHAKYYMGEYSDPCYPFTVEPFRRVNWRVDAVVDGRRVQGDHWDFTTGLGGVIMYYPFDGTLGAELPAEVTDDTGRITFFKRPDPCNTSHTVTYGASNPVVNAASGTSALFEPNACLYRPDPCKPDQVDPLRLEGEQYTIECWIIFNDTDNMDDENVIIEKDDEWFIELEDDGEELRYYHSGDDSGDRCEFGGVEENEWYHVGAVWNQNAAIKQQKLYINGMLTDTRDRDDNNPSDNNDPVGIGCRAREDKNDDGKLFERFLNGRIDELRILDIALAPGKFLLVPGPEWASNPSPSNGDAGIDPNGYLTGDPVFIAWTPGTKVASHKVYFSTNYDDVANGDAAALVDTLPAETNSWPSDVNGLDLTFGRTYHWRIDEVNGGQTWEGVLWKFTSKFLIVDPNMRLWYRFDESDTPVVIDYSGYEMHGAGSPLPQKNWEPAGGRFDGCLKFDDDTGVEVPRTLFDDVGDQLTISVWLNGLLSQDPTNDMVVFHAGIEGAPAEVEVIVPDDDSRVIWRAGNDTNDQAEWEVDTYGWLGDWHHLAFVKDASADEMHIYFDGDLAWTKPGGTKVALTSLYRMPVKVGARNTNDSDYEGKMDDLRIFFIAKSEKEIEVIYRGGDLASAWGPSPYDGQLDAPRDANLAWNAGDYASSHDVYFGTDYDAVRDANTSVPLGVYRGNTSDTVNDIEILELDTYYYWRVDEVNDSNGFKWKGNIWKFKSADYIIIDDFETYIDDSALQSTWVEMASQPAGRTTGARLYLGKYSSQVRYLPHGGDQIMRFGWCNDICIISDVLFSEAWLPMTPDKKDWTQDGVSALTLFFYGLTTNEIYGRRDQMYVGIDDTTGKYAEIRYGDYERAGEEDVNDINIPEWQEWFIALMDFNDPCYAAVPNDVDLTDVNNLYLGFGNRRNPLLGGHGEVRFDDIRLNLPTCVYEITKPVADFTGRRGVPDCVVDWWDIGYFVENEWLKADANFTSAQQEPCDANLIGHWTLDGDPCDSSVYDHNRTISGKYEWSTGHNYDISSTDGAVKFTGSGGRIRVDDSATLRPKYAVTASAWIYYTKSQNNARVVVKGSNNNEAYGLELNNLDNFKFLVRDPCGTQWNASKDRIYPYEWIHIAGTFDGDSNSLKAYVNGELIAQAKDANFVTAGRTLSQDTNDLGIGARPEADEASSGDPFIGSIDEVRVYDYALDANEIALAVMIDEHWLEVKKWP
ncbi:MAG: LamG domain-containing protein [Planctomycetota bacterium]|jgi:hypothetical protein